MNKDILKIVEGLINKTKQNQVDWVHTSALSINNDAFLVDADTEDFAVHTPNYTINLYATTFSYDNIYIGFYNEVAAQVSLTTVKPDDPDYEKIKDLFKMVRKSVLGTGKDDVLKKIQENLAEPGILGGSDSSNDITSF